MKVFHYDSVPSTQDLAHQYVKERSDEAAAFISDQQTAAYGKNGRKFYSPAKTGIYLSLVLPDFKLNKEKIGLLTPFIALKIVEVLQDFFQKADFKIKWVNDLYLNNKKVAGILTELCSNQLIIGLGINLNTVEFPASLKEKAGSITSQEIDKEPLISKLIRALNFASKNYDQVDFLPKYQSLSNLLNKQVVLKIGKKEVAGKVCGFNRNGIILDSDGKLAVYSSGEVGKVKF